jgi:GNAT superfamily N-acetyltransferase
MAAGDAFPIEVRPLAAGERRAVSELLADTFVDYPAWTAIGPRNAPARRRMVRRFYRGAIARATGWGGEVWCAARDGRLAGAAIVYGPGRWPPPSRSSVHEAWGVALAGPGPAIRGLRMGTLSEAARPREPHVFIHTLGVAPRAQRSGAGRALLEPTIAAADRDGRPTHLTTSAPANLPYYRRFGFELVEEAKLGPRSVPVWSMVRPPAA